MATATKKPLALLPNVERALGLFEEGKSPKVCLKAEQEIRQEFFVIASNCANRFPQATTTARILMKTLKVRNSILGQIHDSVVAAAAEKENGRG